MNWFDLSQIDNCYVGGTGASAIYYGNNLIWPVVGPTYTEDNVVFTLKYPTEYEQDIISHSLYTDTNGDPIDSTYSGPILAPTQFINATDIVLNATYRNVHIKTMADLIKMIIDIKNIINT